MRSEKDVMNTTFIGYKISMWKVTTSMNKKEIK
jgi:hypothetical protein